MKTKTYNGNRLLRHLPMLQSNNAENFTMYLPESMSIVNVRVITRHMVRFNAHYAVAANCQRCNKPMYKDDDGLHECLYC